MIPADAATREVHIGHIGEAALQMREERRFARNRAEQQMFEPATDDRVEDWIATMRYAIDFDDVTLCAFTIILREFAEGAFQLAFLRQDTAFQHELRVCR